MKKTGSMPVVKGRLGGEIFKYIKLRGVKIYTFLRLPLTYWQR